MPNFRATAIMILLATTILSSVYITGGGLTVKAQSSTQSGQTITYEEDQTPQYLDPDVSYFAYDFGLLQNIYEPLLWYNGTCSTCVIPWLAQSYTASPDLKTYQFTLRSGIQFADGEPLDSTAVYFSFNRLLINDASTPVGHATQASWILQQLVNTSLSSVLCACSQTYNSAYVDAVLAQNLVQITSSTTFTINVMRPNSAFPYLLANQWGTIVAPNFVMQHDLALWNQSSTGYNLPYPSLSGSPDEMTMMEHYFYDFVATCNAGITPAGCGTTYLDHSYQGSMAGTGPYWIQSVGQSTNDIVMQATPNYWGGPYATKMVPQYTTVNINFVPDQSTREIDLRNAARSGQAMTVDMTNDHVYDVADRNMWINNQQLVSTIPGVTLYGPYGGYATLFDPFDTNVTNIFTGKPYAFQPFADRRFRLAFADAVNMSQIIADVNNNLGQVALNVIPPGLPPEGSYNPSITPIYSYNPVAVQNLLLDAMMNPLTSFTQKNGTAAPAGMFDNSFGCTTPSSSGTCSKPITQTISLVYPTGLPVESAILNAIAGTVNNVSTTYNMGLTVTVEPIPSGTLLTEAFAGNLYMYALAWFADYPWAIDFLGPMYAPGQAYPSPDGWNVPAMGQLYQQAVGASATGNLTGIVSVANAMNTLANQAVMYLWTQYPEVYTAYTSNVAGFSYNPSVPTIATNGGPLFVTLYPATATTTTTSAAGAPSSNLTVAAAAIVIIVIIAVAAMVMRGRKKTKT